MPTLPEQILDKVNKIIMKLDSLPELAQIAGNQVKVVQLSDVAQSLGLLQAGEFRVGNSKVPGFGFSGVRIGYPPFTYNSEVWNVAGVENDVLQFGLRASDGKALAGAGVVILDKDGISVETDETPTDSNKIKFIGISDGTVVGEIYGIDKATPESTQLSVVATSVDGGGGISVLELDSTSESGAESYVNIRAETDSGNFAGVQLSLTSGGAGSLTVFDNTPITLRRTELTISGGVVTATCSHHQIDTESDAASDDLDTINGGTTGQILIIYPANSARTVVAKDGTGNLALAGDFSMDDATDTLMLIKTTTVWQEICRSNNA